MDGWRWVNQAVIQKKGGIKILPGCLKSNIYEKPRTNVDQGSDGRKYD